MENLQRRESGIYVARLTIPARLRRFVGKREFVATTGTSQLSIAKIVAGTMLTRWRQTLHDLDRVALAGSSSLTDDTILRIAEGHPVPGATSPIPLHLAAAVLGVVPETILRSACDGRFDIFHR